ncbi:hypothetical protein M0805_006855 [Coniferiporia weirii]|nr:hypothetical protein M0805_006855 [Coniferiporia weirii]
MSTGEESFKHLKVAVVGGGMCGLVVTAGLQKAGVDVDIYESAPKFGEIGAGVGLGPNAIRVLRDLEMLDDVVAKVKPEQPKPRPCLFLSGFGEHEVVYDYPLPPEDKGLGIHRATFLDALVHLVDPRKAHFNKRCTSLRSSSESRVQINFADGTNVEADVVLGADGIRSSVRHFVLAPEIQGNQSNGNGNGETSHLLGAAFTNTYAYRGLVPNEKLKSLGVKTDLSKRPLCFTGIGKHIITFPIKDGAVINVVAFACDRSYPWGSRPLAPGQPWVTPRTTSELLAEYAGWGRDVLLLLGCIESPSVWAIHAVDPPLTTYVRGRVALLGDAAHGMLPHLGAGAGQALEDALMLVRLLGHPKATGDNVEAVLETYDAIRRPRANATLSGSTKSGNIYDGFGPSGPTSEGMQADVKAYVKGMWEEVWHHDIQADVDGATGELVAKGVF